tara:strand:- start:14980 stop:15825 length:846 start_codon:yes stop_codon:yes gene_type:complete
MKSRHIAGIIIGVIIIALAFVLLLNSPWRNPLIAAGLIIATIQFGLDIIVETKRQREIEEQFLEFSRALESAVRSGVPLPKAILQVSDANYGALSPYVKKLSNQITWGIPLSKALITFSKDTNNKVIKKTISILIEAEKSGGNIDQVLHAATDSVLQVKKIKDERRADAYSQLVQGYFIFFIFIVIMLVMQIYLIPQLSDVGVSVLGGLRDGVESITSFEDKPPLLNLNQIFIGLVLIQGFFAGLMIGKFAEGEIKAGLKHSLVLMIFGYMIITISMGFLA